MKLFIKREIIIFSALLMFLSVFAYGVKAQGIFIRDLKLGDKGEDVKMLQKILNSDGENRVALSGFGSPGQETLYFGPLTRVAVLKFQEKYSSEILYPLGLFTPTGYVGPKTRAKLNMLLEENLPQNQNPEMPSEDSSLILGEPILGLGIEDNIYSESDQFFVSFISSYSGLPGAEVTISGSGFEPENNTIRLGSEFSIPYTKSSGNSITFDIPTNISPGRYDITVLNNRGISESVVFFVVTSPSAEAPKISGIFPSEGAYGIEITIKGENFTAAGNQVRSSYGVIDGIESSDGTTLKFHVLPFPDTPGIENVSQLSGDLDWDIYFYVVNERGVSQEPGVFTMKM